jgi:DNA-binding MarR family transcriptional regulator
MSALDDARATGNAFRRIVRYLRLVDREAEIACGVSAAQLFVLTKVAEHPSISLAELAQHALSDQTSMSTVVARLVARRLISRKPAPDDRRRAELTLTAAGQQLVRSGPRMPHTRMIEAICAMPAAQRAELVSAIVGLAKAIGADEVAPHLLFEDEPRVPKRGRR